MTHEDVLRKVKGLLRLGESDNPNEAASAVAMAHRMMAEHRIEAASLELEGSDESQPAEDLTSLEQPIVVHGVADAEVGVLAAEDVAGDDQDVVGNGFLDEGGGSVEAGGDLGEDEEPAGRLGELEFAVQRVNH